VRRAANAPVSSGARNHLEIAFAIPAITFFNLFVCATSSNAEGPMVDPFVPYTVILDNGPLSPAEDLETAIMAAAQSRASG
jgi:hypothetical protein